MSRLTKPALFLALLFYLTLLMWHPLSGRTVFYSGENTVTEKYTTMALKSFEQGHLPFWNPLMGPGGKPATFVALVAWDYRLVLKSWGLSKTARIYIDYILLALSVFGAFSLLGLGKLTTPWIGLTAFLVFFSIDFVREHFSLQAHNSNFLTLPLLTALIVRAERRRTLSKKAFVALGGLYAFSYMGSQIGGALFQMNLFLGLLVLVLRLSLRRPLLVNCLNRFYSILLLAGIALNFWQLFWLYGLIGESGRVAGHDIAFGQVCWEFLQSFALSPHIFLLSLYSAFAFVFLGKWKFGLPLFGVCLAWAQWGDLTTWFTQDFYATDYYQRNDTRGYLTRATLGFLSVSALVLTMADLKRRAKASLWLCAAFLVYFVILYTPQLHVIRDPGFLGHERVPLTQILIFLVALFTLLKLRTKKIQLSKNKKTLLLFDVPLLLFCTLNFLLYNKSSFNWGPSTFDRLGPIFTAFILTQLFFSLLARQVFLRRLALSLLMALWFLRDHANVLLIRWLGIIWHEQRDDRFVSLCFAILVVIGFVALLEQLKRLGVKPVAITGIALLTLLSTEAPKTLFPPHKYWPANHDTHWRLHVAQVVKQFSTHARPRLLASTDKVASGYWIDDSIFQLDLYDSTISTYTHNLLAYKGFRSMNDFPKTCQVGFLWYANNIHRIFQCPLRERAAYYMSTINIPRISSTAALKELVERHDIEFLALDKPAPPPPAGFKRVATVFTQLKGEQPVYLFHRKNAPIPKEVEINPRSCGQAPKNLWGPVKTKGNHNTDPVVRRHFSYSLPQAERGSCLKLPLLFSKFWSLRVNGREVSPTVVMGGYLGLNVPTSGNLEIVVTYYPQFEWFCFLSVAIFLMLMFWGTKTLGKRQSVRGS